MEVEVFEMSHVHVEIHGVTCMPAHKAEILEKMRQLEELIRSIETGQMERWA